MTYAITYTTDVLALTERGLALCEEGKWPQYMKRVEIDKDGDGVADGIRLIMTKVKTAKADPERATPLASFCLIKLPLRDIVGDLEDTDYVPFVDDVGLDVLAYGEGTYEQVKNDPVALEKYLTVRPYREILDEDDNGTGEFVFDYWIEIDSTVRS